MPGSEEYWIPPEIRMRVLVRKGLAKPVIPENMMPPGMGGGPPPGMGGGPPRPLPPPTAISPGGPEAAQPDKKP
jgi:hypothetical protein